MTLAAVALGLAGSLTWEIAAPEAALPVRAVGPAALPAPAAGPVPAQELAATTLARPLFSPGRRPPAPPRAAPAPLPRLAGVSGGVWARAFLARPAGRTVVLAVGETLDGLTLRGVGPDSATLVGPDGLHVLHLAFADTTRDAPSAPLTSPAAATPTADAGPIDAGPAASASGDGARVRAVLASADMMASAPTSGDCCIPDLGWSRARRGDAPAGPVPNVGRP